MSIKKLCFGSTICCYASIHVQECAKIKGNVTISLFLFGLYIIFWIIQVKMKVTCKK